MNTKFAAIGLLILGAIIEAVTTSPRAQTKPPGYVVAELTVRDMDAIAKDYGPKVPTTLQPFGGHVIVSTPKPMALEGDPPKRFVIIVFDSADKARAWYDSAAYQEIAPIRQRSATSTLFIVEGVPN